MKNLCLILLLLIMAPIFAMEITNKNTDNSVKLSIQVQELCDLFSVQPEKTFSFSSDSSQDFLKFTNSINAISDYSTLRQGIFKTLQILVLTPQEEKNSKKELKILCKTMHKRLIQFTDTEQTAKKYCYNVLDCLSESEGEEEAENPNISKTQIRKNFDTYKLIENSINTTNKNKNNIIVSSQQRTNIIIGKALEIESLKEQLEKAKQEYIDLEQQQKDDEKEIDAINIASNLLKTGASKQLLKMKKQEQKLLTLAQKQHDLVTQLQNEKTQLEGIDTANRTDDDTNKFANKLIELSSAHQKLMVTKIKLSYVTKYIAEANNQTGVLKNFAWYCNFYNYPSTQNKD